MLKQAMIVLLRRLLAVAAMFGLTASLIIYVISFLGFTMEKLGWWAVVLHVGVLAIFTPLAITENSALKERAFFWTIFGSSKPAWVLRSIQIVGCAALVHFVLFMVWAHSSSPQILNGQFVLNDHGTIRQVLTGHEYLKRKADELRLFATGWIFFYFSGAMYWWFPPKRFGVTVV
jgi:hypothetical protein